MGFFRRFVSNGWAIASIVIAFALVKFIFFTMRVHLPIWDEGVYISMAKYFYSMGSIGFLETIRPVLLPLILGPIWKYLPQPLFFSEVLMLFFSCGVIYLTYAIARDFSDGYAGVLSALLLCITPVFFMYSSYILTDIPSVFFVLLAIRSIYLKQNYFSAGLLSALAFLMRFPHIFFAVAMGAYLLVRLLFDAYSSVDDGVSGQERLFRMMRNTFMTSACKETLLNGVAYSLGFMLMSSPFFFFNYLVYSPAAAGWFSAAFTPMLQASSLISTTYLWLYESYPLYFVKGMFLDNPLLAFAIVGVCVFCASIVIKKPKRSSKGKTDARHNIPHHHLENPLDAPIQYPLVGQIILFALVVYLAYFSTLNRMEFRYSLAFLPYACIFASLGLLSSMGYLARKGNAGKMSLAVLALAAAFAFVLMTGKNTSIVGQRGFDTPEIVSKNYLLLQGFESAIPVFTTDPVVGAYLDAKIVPIYYGLDYALDAVSTQDYSAVHFTPRSFPCRDYDDDCGDKLRALALGLSEENNLVFEGEFYGEEYYVFVAPGLGDYPSLSDSALRGKYS